MFFQTGASQQKAGRLLQMLAHSHGQTVNYSKLGASLDMNDNTVRHYLELLEGAFLVRVLKPFHENLKKRLVKAPKAYIRDSGVLHALLGIRGQADLYGHPAFGPSWEGMVIENILSRLSPAIAATYFRTATGEEIDLVLEDGRERVAVECKASAAPGVSGSLHTSMKDINARHAWVVAPVGEAYPLAADVTVCPLDKLFSEPGFKPFVT